MRKEKIKTEEKNNQRLPVYWAVIFVVLLVAVVWIILTPPKEEAVSQIDSREIIKSGDFPNSEIDTVAEMVPRRLDGVFVDMDKENDLPIAVMIENHFDSRPPSGLSKAGLVFEAPVEGGITRFMAVYTNYGHLDKIGPVRSARPYYLDWAKGLGALYLHVGGSPEALQKIKAHHLKDLDQFFKYQYYWRDHTDRRAPHNVYTSGELIGLAKRDIGLEDKKGDFKPWKFKNEVKDNGLDSAPDSQEIVINFSSPEYRVRWRYDNDLKYYLRYHDWKAHKDSDGSHISAQNIVLIYTPIKIIDKKGRRQIKTIGSGKALVFQKGKVLTGEWKKLTRTDRLRIYVADKEVEFIPGTTWVEVVSPTFKIKY